MLRIRLDYHYRYCSNLGHRPHLSVLISGVVQGEDFEHVRVSVVKVLQTHSVSLLKTQCYDCTSLWQSSGLERVYTDWEDVDHMVNMS